MTRIKRAPFWVAAALCIVLAGLAPRPAAAQTVTAKAVSACGAESYSAGPYQYLEQTITGLLCTNSSGGGGSGGTVASASKAVNISSATTTQIIPVSTGNPLLITSIDFVAAGIDSVTLEYGTGSNCGTGTTALTGAYPLTAQTGLAKGTGVGTILFVPVNNALCILTSGNVQLSGSISYATTAAAGSAVSATASAAITMSSATTTRFITASGSTATYITSFDMIAAGTTNATLVYGTGSNCATGLTAMTGAYPLTAQVGLGMGDGVGAVLFAPASQDVCVVNSAAVQLSGSLSYAQQ